MLNSPIRMLLPGAKKWERVRREVHLNFCSISVFLGVKWCTRISIHLGCRVQCLHGDRKLYAIYKEKSSWYLLKSTRERPSPDQRISFCEKLIILEYIKCILRAMSEAKSLETSKDILESMASKYWQELQTRGAEAGCWAALSVKTWNTQF